LPDLNVYVKMLYVKIHTTEIKPQNSLALATHPGHDCRKRTYCL